MIDSPAASSRRRIRRPLLLLSVAAWAATLWLHQRAWGGSVLGLAAAGGGAQRSGLAHRFICTLPAPGGRASVSPWSSAAGFAGGWTLMLVAMMGPLLSPALLHVVDRTLPRRRRRAVVEFTAGYAGVWLVGGAALLALAGLAARRLDTGVLVVAVVLVGLLWQCSPARQRCSNRHHATPPLAAFGRRADLDVLRFGLVHGARCFGTCWPWMLVPLVVGSGHVVAMVLVSLLLWADRFEPPRVPAWRIRVPRRWIDILGGLWRDRRRSVAGRRVRAWTRWSGVTGLRVRREVPGRAP